MNTRDWQQGHKQFQAALDADQVECRALLDGISNFDFGLRDEQISGVLDDALIEAGNSWAERQALLEDSTGAIAEEIGRRAQIMGDAYPFQIQPGAILYAKSKTGVYEFCLAVSRNPVGRIEPLPSAAAIFEWISRDVLAAHLGDGAIGFRTGAPAYECENRGTSARQTFETLAARCGGEFNWNPLHGLPEEPEHRFLKDIGLDVVVWKPWEDRRPAQLFAIGQCACGKNDINPAKGRELSLKRLENWLRPTTIAPALRCFFAALHVPNDVRLIELSGEAGIVFDRARITLLAEKQPDRVISKEGYDYHELAEAYIIHQQVV